MPPPSSCGASASTSAVDAEKLPFADGWFLDLLWRFVEDWAERDVLRRHHSTGVQPLRVRTMMPAGEELVGRSLLPVVA